MLRKILVWSHLAAGVVAGVLIFVMSVTGVLLTFERQTLDWVDRHEARVVPPPGAVRIPASELIAKSGGTPAAVIVRSDPAEPVELAMGRDRTIYLNPYTGLVTGSPNKQVHAFFQSTRAWHRWIAMSDSAQKNTEPIYDAANVLFFLIVLSGPFLWWPKKLTWRHLRPIVWFRGGLSGKARDFNWHNAIGLWTSIPLVFIVGTGIILSYQWANDLVYRITGNEPLKPVRVETMKGQPPKWQGVDEWLTKAESHMPDWRTITIRSSPARTVTVTVDAGTGGQLGGITVQALAGLASLGGAVLVYTGITLSLRRFAAWRRRKARSVAPEVAQVVS
jgi:uncharacterized iron-regulated membrane protein